MRNIETLGNYANVQRPIAFLAGLWSEGDNWQQRVWNGLKDLPKGTVLNPRPNFENLPVDGLAPHELWAMDALEIADVIGLWFPSGGAAQVESILLLGKLMGRYQMGAGPRRLVVGMGENYPFRGRLKDQFDRAMHRIEPTWQVEMSMSMEAFIADMQKAIRYVTK